MKKVMCICGGEEVGKTTTLNRVALDIFSKVKLENIVKLNVPIKNFIKTDHIYKFKYNEKMFLIITAGDNEKVVEKVINENIEGVDVIICAIRNGKIRYKNFKNFVKEKDFEFKDFPKISATDADNDKVFKEIILELKNINYL